MSSLIVLSPVVLNKFDILAITLKKLENEGLSLRTVNEMNTWMKRTEKITNLEKISQRRNF